MHFPRNHNPYSLRKSLQTPTEFRDNSAYNRGPSILTELREFIILKQNWVRKYENNGYSRRSTM